MTFVAAMRALRARWPSLAAGLLVGILAALVVSVFLPARYEATATVYVAGIDAPPGTGSDAYASALLVQQRSASYRQLATSGRVLDPVAQELGVPVSADTIAASSQTNSAIFALTATADDPARAALVVDAVAERFARVIGEVDRPAGPSAPPSVTGTVLDPAVSAQAVGPSTGLNVLVGAVVGLVAAAAAAVMGDALRRTIRTTDELEAVTGTAALGPVPVAGGARPGEEAHESAVRRLRDLLSVSHDDLRVLTVAGAVADSGTTALVRSLARAFAHGERVLVVDADLGRPDGPSDGAVGLSDVLEGRATTLEAIRMHDGLDLLPRGAAGADPGRLLAADRTAEVLDELRGRYDRVLVDGVPLATALDAALLARHGDGLLLVARSGRTRAQDVRTAVAALDATRTRLLGAALTVVTGRGRGGGRTDGDRRTPVGARDRPSGDDVVSSGETRSLDPRQHSGVSGSRHGV